MLFSSGPSIFMCSAHYIYYNYYWTLEIDTLEDREGYIDSPNYPNQSPTYSPLGYTRTCTWILTGRNISLEVMTFDVEDSKGGDYLQINNGQKYRRHELQPGYTFPSSSRFTIYFYIDRTVASNGFRLKFTGE